MPWSVAQTQPFSERKAQRFLESKNFCCYLPKIQQCRYLGGSKMVREFPLFTRYIFVFFDSIWHEINSTPGIANLLTDGEQKPITIGENVIREIKSREDRSGFVVLPRKAKFKIGDNVRIVSGQFAGQLALYAGMTSRQRERVLLEILGAQVPCELNIDSRIEAVTVH